jgi:hypothetical protein
LFQNVGRERALLPPGLQKVRIALIFVSAPLSVTPSGGDDFEAGFEKERQFFAPLGPVSA